jgi:cytochrome b
VTAAPARIRVWDLPTRIFHWTLVVLVVFSFTTGKIGGGWMGWHLKSGYAILTLLLFRLAWGVAGSSTSRFSGFVRGPVAFYRYAGEIISKRHRAVVGHNPMGGWMVIVLLVVLLAQAGSGLFSDDEIATQGPLAEKVSNAVVGKMSSFHGFNGWIIAVAAGVHVLAIAYYWFGLKDDLVKPMWNGWRAFDAGVAQPPMRAAWLAAVLLALAAAAVYWLVVVYPKG